MGWDDWTPEAESEPGMVRGVRVQWSPFPSDGLIVRHDDEDSMRVVLVTGDPPNMTIERWLTAGEAKRLGTRTYDG